MNAHKRSAKAQALTDLMVLVFRLNGRLIERGDDLVKPLGITSARWQLLGAADQAMRPATSPQLSRAMGISPQAAQKQLHRMVKEGFLDVQANPLHARSPLYSLTQKGRRTIAEAKRLQTLWSNQLARCFKDGDALSALDTLQLLFKQLAAPLPRPEARQ